MDWKFLKEWPLKITVKSYQWDLLKITAALKRSTKGEITSSDRGPPSGKPSSNKTAQKM